MTNREIYDIKFLLTRSQCNWLGNTVVYDTTSLCDPVQTKSSISSNTKRAVFPELIEVRSSVRGGPYMYQ